LIIGKVGGLLAIVKVCGGVLVVIIALAGNFAYARF